MSKTPDILLVDYGMGNLRSVARAFERVDAKARVSSDPGEVVRADRVVVPGVGAMGDAMRELRERGLEDALRKRIPDGRPYLGLCLGLQILFERGEEGPAEGLALCPGAVNHFGDLGDLPVPHMGWNRVECTGTHPVLADDYFYFVHGYRPERVPEARIAAHTDYGGRFASAVAFDACVAVQFHPEKSQRAGLALFERFCAWAP